MDETKTPKLDALFESIEYAVLCKAVSGNRGDLDKARERFVSIVRAHMHICDLIEGVDNRCMAGDIVTPTHKEITASEIARIYELARLAVAEATRE
jgi:hypothetical protein